MTTYTDYKTNKRSSAKPSSMSSDKSNRNSWHFDFTTFTGPHAASNNLITGANADTVCNVQTQHELVWAKVAVAMDSGAVAHVSPANVFTHE